MSLIQMNLKSRKLYMNTNVNIALPEVPEGRNPREYYESNGKLKVLWLLHGGNSDCSAWERKTRIEKYAVPRNLMVVMPEAYNSFYTNWPEILMNWEDYFLDELMPCIYNWFPASDKPEDNFIAGESMGGIGAAKYVANHPEMFGGAAIFSVGPVDFNAEPTGPRDERIRYQYLLANGGLEQAVSSSDNAWDLLVKNKDRLPRIYCSCGTGDDHYDQVYLKFKEHALANGLPIEFREIPEYGHDWALWNSEIEYALDWFGLKAE